MEETIRKAMGDLFSRLDESNRRRDQADHTYDQTLKELRDGFIALKVQNSELMVKLKADNGGNSSAASTRSNTCAHCFPTRQSKVDSPIVFVNDLNGSGTCITAPKLLQPPASTTTENLQPRDKSVEEYITRFLAEISNFISSNFYDPMVELRSLKQLGMVPDYLNQFKTLLAKVEINESYVVHLFVSGLHYHIQNSVRMFRPKSLAHAFALARLQESSLNFRGIYYADLEVKDEVCMAEIENEMVMKLKGKEISSEDSYENVEVTEKVWLEQTETGMVMSLKEKESSFEGNFELMNSTSFAAQELHSITAPEIAIELSKNSSSTLGGGSNPDMDDVDVDDAVWNKSIGVLQRKTLDVGHNLIGYPRAEGLAVAEVKGADLLSRAPVSHLEFGGWKKYLNFRDDLLKDTQRSLRDMNAMVPDAIHTAPKVLHEWIEEPRHRTT
ncbi:hypothetical protein SASPL_149216 [Salvia splendens]|uniref:Retrotransposon gag domain-containing protein n=1 Tax=Salvia splendens TaxID=180675 RepID=A0A8X8WBB4_SALSN|nr:hypothetical protein SASPL_149216 [Salvia splendens]